MVRYNELTKYPKIYGETYWGGFDSELSQVNSVKSLAILSENRNMFIEQFEIKKMSKRPEYVTKVMDSDRKQLRSLFDHCECYVDKDNWHILVCSPYWNYEYDDDLISEAIDLGYYLYKPLYSMESVTMIKFIHRDKNLTYQISGNYLYPIGKTT
jgi:hypothetical protein